MAKKKLVMENRAWRGIRLSATKELMRGNRAYHYTIEYHVPIGKFQLSEQTCKPERMRRFTGGLGPWHRACYGGSIAYSDRIGPLLNFIEKRRNVKVTVKNRANVCEQERYAIEDGKATLRKFPKWKTDPPANKPVLIVTGKGRLCGKKGRRR